MKRWFVARIGAYDAEQPDVTVPKVAAYTHSYRVWTKSGFGWSFGQCAAPDFTAMQADPDIYIVPDAALGMSVGSIPAGVRNTMRSRLEAAGFTFGYVKTTWTVKQLLGYLRMQIQPPLGPDVEDGDVADVEQ